MAIYCLLILGLWGWMLFDGDRGVLATLILFGPRWVCILPLPLLCIAALAVDRRALWALAAAAVVIVFPVMGFQLHLPASGDGPSTLRVLTCNVEENVFDTRALRALIEREQAGYRGTAGGEQRNEIPLAAGMARRQSR